MIDSSPEPGANLKAALQSRGLSYAKAAIICGVSGQHLERLSNGRCDRIKKKTAKQLKKAFGKDVVEGMAIC